MALKRNKKEMAWLAGFIDGEGYTRYHPYLIITNINYEILNDIRKLVGSGHIYKLSRAYKQKQAFQYKLTEMKALKDFLRFIQPYLHLKRKHR